MTKQEIELTIGNALQMEHMCAEKKGMVEFRNDANNGRFMNIIFGQGAKGSYLMGFAFDIKEQKVVLMEKTEFGFAVHGIDEKHKNAKEIAQILYHAQENLHIKLRDDYVYVI